MSQQFLKINRSPTESTHLHTRLKHMWCTQDLNTRTHHHHGWTKHLGKPVLLWTHNKEETETGSERLQRYCE